MARMRRAHYLDGVTYAVLFGASALLILEVVAMVRWL